MTRRFLRILYFAFLISFLQTESIIAQTNYDNAPIYVENNSFTFLPIARAEVFIPSGGSYLYYDFAYNSNNKYTYLTNGYKFSQTIGLEYRANAKWYIGTNIRHLISYSDLSILKPRVHFSHRGKLWGIDLIKEVSAEYLFHFGRLAVPDARFGFALAAHKGFNIRESMRVGIITGIKPFINTSVLGIYDHQFFDFLQFHAMAYLCWKNKLTFGLGYLNDQEFLVASATYDQNYNLVYPDRKLHRVTPALTLFISYMLFAKSEYEIIPNLPLR